MNAIGELRIVLDWKGAEVRGARLISSRPLDVLRVVAGQPAATAPRDVRALFSICQRAQGVAARRAVEQAVGLPSRGADDIDGTVVALETAMVHLWRVLIDLPRALGQPPRLSMLAPLYADAQRLLDEALGADWPQLGVREAIGGGPRWPALLAQLAGAVEQEVLGMSLGRWRELDSDGLQDWLERRQSTVAAALARLAAAAPLWPDEGQLMTVADRALVGEIARSLAQQPGFAAQPTRNGVALETGALARQAGRAQLDGLRQRPSNGVVVRLIAGLIELVEIVEALQQRATPSWRLVEEWSDEGVGVGWVETARGLLVHRVEVRGQRVTRYQLVPPTAWNFHPRGSVAAALGALRAETAETLRRAAQLIVLAADPCVTYVVELG